MRTTTLLRKISFLLLSLFFFVPNVNSKVVYNSISAHQIELPCPVEKRKAKKNKRKANKLKKQKRIRQSTFFSNDSLSILFAVILSLMIVLGVIFFVLGAGSVLFLVLGIVLISVGLIALFLIGYFELEEIIGLAFGMAFLVGLFFLIFGILSNFIALWIIGIIIIGAAVWLGLHFLFQAIISGNVN
jgi:hypothetical protein